MARLTSKTSTPTSRPCEIVYRKLLNGSETDTERVVALRTHPLQIEFHQRNTADGFRVQWDMPKSAPLGSVDAFVREAKRMEGVQPTTVGYGITSDPIRDASFDSLFAAVNLSIKEPWRVIEVDQAGCSVQDCDGYTLRRMKLRATGENVVERITINEEAGSVTYNKCDASGRPGDVERVLAIHTPLRIEFYERSARSGLRVDWKAPYSMARDTFSNLVQVAKGMTSSSGATVGFGLASKPLDGMSQDAVWSHAHCHARSCRCWHEGGQRKGAGHERLHAAIHAPSGKAWQPDCDRQHPRNGGCPGDLVPPRQEWSGVRGGAGVCFAHGASQI